VVDIASNTETRVCSVKEPSGFYNMPFQERPPIFKGKVVKGYFDKESILYLGVMVDTAVFIMTGIVGDRTAVIKTQSSRTSGSGRHKFIRELATGRMPNGIAYDIRGRIIHDVVKKLRIIIRRVDEVK
jgi:hypothetical protein